MLHLTRWRVVGATAATATTAVLAAGALGLTSSLAGPPSGPAPIELESIDASDPARPVPITDDEAAPPDGPGDGGDRGEAAPSEVTTPEARTSGPSGAAARTEPDDDRIVSPQGPVVQEPAPPRPPASATSFSSVSSPSSIDS